MILVPSDLEPGILKVRINHYLGAEKEGLEGSDNRSVLKSNPSSFVLAPRIVAPRVGKVSRGSELAIEFEPPVSKEKSVYAYLGDRGFPATLKKSMKSTGDPKFDTVKFRIPEDITIGFYLLRVVIDGAMSILVRDEDPRSQTFKKFIGPHIEVF